VKPKIAKTLTGKLVVKYRCPNCEDKLVSPLDEVGLKDTCPNCNTKYVVPGQAEKVELATRQEAARDAAARKKAEELAATEKRVKESGENATRKTNAESITHHDSKPSANLIACPDCGRMVSPRAQLWLECGAPISQQSPTRTEGDSSSHRSRGCNYRSVSNPMKRPRNLQPTTKQWTNSSG
jgi:DNA-directed RNA polymerase subunit RPC12/RpoP